MTRRILRVVELYAGTARSVQPFRSWRRCELALLVDNDEHAKATYLHNFPKAPYLKRNLARMKPAEVERRAGGRVDILLGCPPCQGFSDVGSRDPSDPRNAHLARFALFIEQMEPLAVLMENVPLAVDTSRFAAFTSRLERAGYRWTAGVVNAALRGSSQCRQRLVLAAFHERTKVEPKLSKPSHGGEERYFSYRHRRMCTIDDDRCGMLGESPGTQRMAKELPFRETQLGSRRIPTVGDILDSLPRLGTAEARRLSHVPWDHSAKHLKKMDAVPEGGRWKGGCDHFAQAYGRLHRRGLARTITTYFNNAGSGRFWHPTSNRALTVREAARIQGFPDSFLFLPKARASRLIGNALDSAIASMGYDLVRAALE